MKITAQDLKKFGVIDDIVPEPLGGAHRNPAQTITDTGEALAAALSEFDGMTGDDIRAARRKKYLDIGEKL
jgi:acetyl-CoA carboxylase carboxyl transferase subunit alpha